ncbi:WD40 repeat domain-containing protein [Actinokineospora auranticolor]|nr:WD40 repeat domain-containing protein [Actinokineospora auranticolor]
MDIAFADGNGLVRVINTNPYNRGLRQWFDLGAGTVWDLAFQPEGRGIASAHENGDIRYTDFAAGTTRTLGSHGGEAISVAFSPDGRHLVSGGTDATVRLWDIESGTGRVLSNSTWRYPFPVFLPDGRRVAYVGEGDISYNDSISDTRWSSDLTPSVPARPSRHRARPRAGRGDHLGRLRWRTGVLGPAGSPGAQADPLRYSRHLVAGSRAAGEALGELEFTPSGTELAIAGWDNTLRLWDPVTGASLRNSPTCPPPRPLSRSARTVRYSRPVHGSPRSPSTGHRTSPCGRG